MWTLRPAPSGLVSWWRGEDNANDQMGVNNGTLMNGAAFETGKSRPGVQLRRGGRLRGCGFCQPGESVILIQCVGETAVNGHL